MVYTDGIHLMAASVEELHAFAEKVGIKRCWFEGVRKGHPHYDLNAQNKNKAIDGGAILVTSRELVNKFKEYAYA